MKSREEIIKLIYDMTEEKIIMSDNDWKKKNYEDYDDDLIKIEVLRELIRRIEK